MAETAVLDRTLVTNLLRDSTGVTESEEDQRPWGSNDVPSLYHPWAVEPDEPLGAPLLRIWDPCSGSRPEKYHEGRMRARAPRLRLDTSKSRMELLAHHINHKQPWVKTPFISFTSASKTINDLTDMRVKRGNRGELTLAVVNPNMRIAIGLPIIDIGAEMKYYGVKNPYDDRYGRNKFEEGHFLCLWEVGPQEIVCQIEWSALASNPSWYEDIVMPEFKAHEQSRLARMKEDETVKVEVVADRLADLETTMGEMSLKSKSTEDGLLDHGKEDTSGKGKNVRRAICKNPPIPVIWADCEDDA